MSSTSETKTPLAVNTQDRGQELNMLLRAAANRPRAAARALLRAAYSGQNNEANPPAGATGAGGDEPCH